MVSGDGSDGHWQLPGSVRVASSIARSAERKKLEGDALVDALRDQFERWCERGDWLKLKCIELIIVRGIANKRAATILGITEQQVANYKFDFLARTRTLIRRQGLDHEVFPELYEDK
jgi:RNA polymerase sigma-70 factor (ECF subfamily)